MKKSLKQTYKDDGQDRLLSKLSLFIFDRPRTTALIWLCLTIFGVFSYTSFLQREGFPSISIPYSIVSGNYLVNDAQKVDEQIAKPVSDIALKDSRVKSVQSQAQGSFYVVTVQYKEGTDVAKAAKDISRKITDAQFMPKQASIKVETPKMGFTERGDDAVISVYSKQKDVSTEQLVKDGQALTDFIKSKNLQNVDKVSVIDPFITGINPATGQQATQLNKFDRYGYRADSQNKFYDSVSVGVTQKSDADVIKLDDELQAAVKEFNSKYATDESEAVVSAGYAADIKSQISELQKALFEGLIAVLLIGSIVIAVRASIITVLAMISVLAITLGVLFTAGYSLNTITLFSLILCLGLIVDDTIIMVEALDAQRRKQKDARQTIKVATRKVSRAMVAATSTAALSFAPLLFVGGILGSFIRAIPVTVITSLLVSLLVALFFIPFFARYILLGKKQMGKGGHVAEPLASVEARVANFIGRPMLWARNSKKKLFGVGTAAVLFGFSFIAAGVVLFQHVTFNIFPPSKDSNGLIAKLEFQPGTSIKEAQAVVNRADSIVADTLGKEFKTASYYSSASSRTAMLYINITAYDERDVTAPQLQEKLADKFENFQGAKVTVRQQDVGPPASAFSVRVDAQDRDKALRLAGDINSFLMDRELTRASGEKAKITETAVVDPSTYNRSEGKPYIEVSANFDSDDTTTLVTLAKDAVNKEFTESKLQQYGLPKDALQYDFGQEDENQESFAALAMAFPILLFVIYLLLAIQFRSLAQPLLIFMAIPFSLFGITLGLYASNNAFSFFAMLGFFALIGLSIKNTILLTDYANQLRRSGSSAVDAAVGALGERFRPLIATSLTAVVSLIPLALSSPFWEGLAVVLICGLLSSTLLVILVFPYYYLGAEYLRLRISRKAGLLWLGLSIALIVGLSAAKLAAVAALAPVVVAIAMILIARTRKKSRTA